MKALDLRPGHVLLTVQGFGRRVRATARSTFLQTGAAALLEIPVEDDMPVPLAWAPEEVSVVPERPSWWLPDALKWWPIDETQNEGLT